MNTENSKKYHISNTIPYAEKNPPKSLSSDESYKKNQSIHDEIIDLLINNDEFLIDEITQVLQLRTRAKIWGRYEVIDTIADRFNMHYFDIKIINKILKKLDIICFERDDISFHRTGKYGSKFKLNPKDKDFVPKRKFKPYECTEKTIEKETETAPIDFRPYIPVGTIDKDGFDENHVCSI